MQDNNLNNLNKKLDPIAENLSRPTTHDTALISGPQSGLTSNLYTTGSNLLPQTGFTGVTSGLSSGLGSNINTGLQNFENEFIPSTGTYNYGSNLTSGTTTGTFGTTGLGTDFHRFTEGSAVLNPDSKFINDGTLPMNFNTPTQMPIVTEPPIDNFASDTTQPKKHGIMGKVKDLIRGKHETAETGMTGTEGMGMDAMETEKKPGFLSKITSHIPIIGHKKDTTANMGTVSTEPLGVLDEKGTTVGVPGDVVSTSQLGLPVAGPDYTHGTHGLTHDTVFTGGFQPTQVANTSLPLQSGLNTGLATNLGTGLGTEFGTTLDKPTFGVDYSGTNATHVNRDITLQEGGLLGLRQGAVTANPGDIITNFFDRDKVANIQQPVIGTGYTTTGISTQAFETGRMMDTGADKTIATGYGTGGCTLVQPDLNRKIL